MPYKLACIQRSARLGLFQRHRIFDTSTLACPSFRCLVMANRLTAIRAKSTWDHDAMLVQRSIRLDLTGLAWLAGRIRYAPNRGAESGQPKTLYIPAFLKSQVASRVMAHGFCYT
jgi:hypothetical protein